MRKPRKTESAEERAERISVEAKARRDESDAAEKAVDAMVRRSIQLFGP